MTLQTKTNNDNYATKSLVVTTHEDPTTPFGKYYYVFPKKTLSSKKYERDNIQRKAHDLEEELFLLNLDNKRRRIICPSTEGLSYTITHGDGIYTSSIHWYGRGQIEPESIGLIEENGQTKRLNKIQDYEEPIDEFEKQAAEEFFREFTSEDFLMLKEIEEIRNRTGEVPAESITKYARLTNEKRTAFNMWKSKTFVGEI